MLSNQKNRLGEVKKPVVLNSEFRQVIKLIESTNESVFITGRAGTGKSTLLRLFRDTTKKNIVVLAPTGIAALHVKGQTIHSFFKFAPNFLPKSKIKKVKRRRIYQKLDTIVIDEISMVRADMLDNIDLFLRLNRDNPLPFGGVQMVFIGDLFQIPPVISTDFEREFLYKTYETPYFFSASVLNSENFYLNVEELNQIFRQTDHRFINLLESIRLNQMDWDLLEELNSRHNPDEIMEGFYITLSARNSQVQKINEKRLSELDRRIYVYSASQSGSFPNGTYPTDFDLSLKVGAQVMFIRNDIEKRYVNGTIGKVVELGVDKVVVEINKNDSIIQVNVEREEWEAVRYYIDETNPKNIEQEVVGIFNQYPLKLAWAITIHKSQGKTFENIIVDLGAKGAFANGQTYVALSRCTSLEGIVLKTPIKPQDIMVDNRIIEFLENKRRY